MTFRQTGYYTAVVILIAIGILGISLTYPIFSQAGDEPAHIARGMEWLDKKQYTYDQEHPPLAPVMVAIGPFLNGVRSYGLESRYSEGNAILHANHTYFKNLTLARLGILPFFVVATIFVGGWAKLYFGKLTALLSVFLFTTLPPVLGNSGLATTDMAFTAMFAAALYTLCLWIEKPTLLRTHIVALMVGLACLAKLSALVYLPVSAASIIIAYLLGKKHNKNNYFKFKKLSLYFGIAFPILILTVWAGYRFSTGVNGLPAPEFWTGIEIVKAHNSNGHLSYLWGEISQHGWWYYFPVAIAVKTPLPFLLLLIYGFIILLVQAGSRRENIRNIGLVVASLSVLAVAMSSNINIGLRHILPVYPICAIIAGYGAYHLLTKFNPQKIGKTIVAALLLWQLTATATAHPDYLAYFNELAGNRPENILIDSNLDWGQDIYRLATALEKRNIDKFSGCLFSSIDDAYLKELGFPQMKGLQPNQIATGWVAVSVNCLKWGTRESPYNQFAWLENYEPVEKVGSSIYLYYIPKAEQQNISDLN